MIPHRVYHGSPAGSGDPRGDLRLSMSIGMDNHCILYS